MNSKDSGFCTECGHVIENFDGLDRCPACGSRGVPCSWKDQVSVSVNWHELRILVIWAENWAREHKQGEPGMSRAVYAIARRLQEQAGAGRAPLTLAGELADLVDHFPGVAINDPRLRQDIAEQIGREIDLLRKPDDAEEARDG